jgi:hypothetical protein
MHLWAPPCARLWNSLADRLPRSRRRAGARDLDRVLEAHRHCGARAHHARRAGLRQADAGATGDPRRASPGLARHRGRDRRHGAARRRRGVPRVAARPPPRRDPFRHVLRVRRAADAPARLSDAALSSAGSGARRPDCRLPDSPHRPQAKTVAALRGSASAIAAGAPNDTAMLAEADAGILFRPPENVVRDFPQFPVASTYEELRAACTAAAARLDASESPDERARTRSAP